MTEPGLPRRELTGLAPRQGAYEDVVARAGRRRAGRAAAAGGALLLTAAAVVGAVLVLPGGTDGDDRLVDQASPRPSASASPSAPVTVSPSPRPVPTGAASPADHGTPAPGSSSSASVVSRTVSPDDVVSFQSPSGNIHCGIWRDRAVCEILDHDFQPPPKPADCEYDWGQMLGVQGGAEAAFMCHSDTGVMPDNPVLPYGQQLTNGEVTCRSTRTAVECETGDGRHGFEVARAAFRLY